MKHLFGLLLLALVAVAPVNMGMATLVSLPSPVFFPGLGQFNNSFYQLITTATLTSAGHYMSYVFAAREDMVISHVAFRVGTVAGSPTATVSIETLDSSGLPSGTPWNNTGGTSVGTTGTLTTNTYTVQALAASATITKGQVYAVKIALASGTSMILQQGNMLQQFSSALPYKVTNTGTPTKGIATAEAWAVALGSSSTTFYQVPGLLPGDSASGTAFNNTNGQARGMVFTIPMNCRVIGVRWLGSNATGDYNIILQDNSNNNLSSTAYTGTYSAATTTPAWNAYFTTPVSITAGGTYRLAIEPTSTTNVSVTTIVMSSSIYRGAFPGQNTVSYTTRTSGSWTDTNTQIPMMELIIDQIDNGAGSGSGGGRIIGG